MNAPLDFSAVAASLHACTDPQKRHAADVIYHLQRELAEQRRRIEAALGLIDGREDVEDKPDCGDEQIVRPNLEMRIGMALRGEDRP
jgi:hypothetical protein